ncbi:hypothetical protein LguiA_019935 [Lonicera macranthoides]
MAKLLIFAPLSLFLLLIPLTTSSNPNPNPNTTTPLPTLAHTELIKYGFPTGLLPTNVATYSVNSTSGEFTVHLSSKCHLTLPPDNYLATYSKKITGKIVEGKIGNLDGISVRAFFKWWGITGIKSNGENLIFEVGMVTAKYPSKNFQDIPECDGKHSAS